MRPKRFNKYPTRHVPRRSKDAPQGKVFIYGRHALLEALRNAPTVVRKVFLSRDVRDAELRALLEKHAIPTTELATGRGKELVGSDAPHQGVIATMNPSALLISLDDF